MVRKMQPDLSKQLQATYLTWRSLLITSRTVVFRITLACQKAIPWHQTALKNSSLQE